MLCLPYEKNTIMLNDQVGLTGTTDIDIGYFSEDPDELILKFVLKTREFQIPIYGYQVEFFNDQSVLSVFCDSVWEDRVRRYI